MGLCETGIPHNSDIPTALCNSLQLTALALVCHLILRLIWRKIEVAILHWRQHITSLVHSSKAHFSQPHTDIHVLIALLQFVIYLNYMNAWIPYKGKKVTLATSHVLQKTLTCYLLCVLMVGQNEKAYLPLYRPLYKRVWRNSLKVYQGLKSSLKFGDKRRTTRVKDLPRRYSFKRF